MTAISKVSPGLKHCHHPALDSVVLSDSPFMIRAFIATGESGDRTVAPHTHRASLYITVLQGRIWHDTFSLEKTRPDEQPTGRIQMCNYKSVLLAGDGLSKPYAEADAHMATEEMGPGDITVLAYNKPHTVRWSADAIWVIEESALMTDETQVWLRKSIDRFDTEGLYVAMTDAELEAGIAKVSALWGRVQ